MFYRRNPANDMVTLTGLHVGNSETSLLVYDVNGKLALSKTIKEESYRISDKVVFLQMK